jgi:hypothetical protein
VKITDLWAEMRALWGIPKEITIFGQREIEK